MYQLQVRIRRKYMKIALIYLRNNLRLNEISILTILQTYCKIQKNQLEIIVKATYSLHPNKYFEMSNLLEEACFRLHSNSRGADKILKDFCSRTTEFYSCLVHINLAVSRVMNDFILVKQSRPV